jgi:hypothetical protein
MVGDEKRVNEVKSRFTDSEYLALSKLAALDDRTIADYLHHVALIHLYGHSYKLVASVPGCNQTIRGG